MGHPAGLSFSPARTDARAMRRRTRRCRLCPVLSRAFSRTTAHVDGLVFLTSRANGIFPLSRHATVCAHTFPYASACRGLPPRKPRPTLISSLYTLIMHARAAGCALTAARERPPRRFNGRCRCRGGGLAITSTVVVSTLKRVHRVPIHTLGKKSYSTSVFFPRELLPPLSLSLSLYLALLQKFFTAMETSFFTS